MVRALSVEFAVRRGGNLGAVERKSPIFTQKGAMIRQWDASNV